MKDIRFEWIQSIKNVSKNIWNDFCKEFETPILDWEWFFNLEVSRSTSPSTGWYVNHLLVYLKNKIIGIVPLFIKTHSWGEFVFDFEWEDLANSLKIPYFPKIVGMSPFTPSVGYQFLLDPEYKNQKIISLILEEIKKFSISNNIYSSHFQYVDPEFSKYLEENNYIKWVHQNFIWENKQFKSFDDYLSQFNKNQRNKIKKEMRTLDEHQIKVKYLSGDEISDNYFQIMYQYYESTNDKFGVWGAKFLNLDFFSGLKDNFKDRLLFIAAFKENISEPIALSFFMIKERLMIGRYWGAKIFIPDLHFNLCYYNAIEWAINNKVERIDPGIGSEHKLRRGFKATPFYSYHRYFNPSFHEIFDKYIREWNELQMQYIHKLNNTIPYKKS